MIRHANISIFVPNIGCPQRCIFCDQRAISGKIKAPRPEEVTALCDKYADNGMETEIAFFGGSFTAVPRDYMISLLEAAYPFVKQGRVRGIRISTRPDAIDTDILDIMKRYSVTSIELGAQSMLDSVLEANSRGHTATDVEKASHLISKYGFALGLQMMVGMYGDENPAAGAMYTAERIASLSPNTVRIYPTQVIKGTGLCSLWEQGEYIPLDLDTAVDICADLLVFFEQRNIRVIRSGLHSDIGMQETRVAGPYHPAFGDLCRSRIFLNKIIEEAGNNHTALVRVNPRSLSSVIGNKRCNIALLAQRGITADIVPDAEVPAGEIRLSRY